MWIFIIDIRSVVVYVWRWVIVGERESMCLLVQFFFVFEFVHILCTKIRSAPIKHIYSHKQTNSRIQSPPRSTNIMLCPPAGREVVVSNSGDCRAPSHNSMSPTSKNMIRPTHTERDAAAVLTPPLRPS